MEVGDAWHYLLTQSYVWLHYVRLFFVPLGLTGRYGSARILALVRYSGSGWPVVPHAAAWRALGSSRTRRARPIAFGIAWFGIALVPASSVFPLAEVANEHRVFLPYIGLALAVVWWLALRVHTWCETWPQRRPMIVSIACAVTLLVLGGHAIGTYQRNKVWRSEETLWRDVVQKSPTNGRALMNYGLTQMSQGKYAEAKRTL